MRLAAQAKMGYYPTPQAVVELVSNILNRSGNGRICLLDPCAGEGHALQYIGSALKAITFGIELDQERGRIAKQNLHHCLITDYANSRISNRAFSLLYLNPPYDWETRINELSESERYERTFLRNTIRYLMTGGILVYLIPQARLDKNIAGILANRFTDLKVFRFPEKEYQAFKQIVIFGITKKRGEPDEQLKQYLIEIGKNQAMIPYLDQADCKYDLPVSDENKNFMFRSLKINVEELEKELEKSTLQAKIREMTKPVKLTGRIKPIMPLRQGHLAQLLACGMMNGVVFDENGENPLIIKGVTKKIVEKNVEYDDDKEKVIETDRIIINIKAFNEYGEIITIE